MGSVNIPVLDYRRRCGTTRFRRSSSELSADVWWGERPLGVVDVGVSGGIHASWDAFDPLISAIGFDPLVTGDCPVAGGSTLHASAGARSRIRGMPWRPHGPFSDELCPRRSVTLGRAARARRNCLRRTTSRSGSTPVQWCSGQTATSRWTISSIHRHRSSVAQDRHRWQRSSGPVWRRAAAP